MIFNFNLNYCGVCGKKLKEITIPNSKERIRHCKKCGYFLPIEATKYVCFSSKLKEVTSKGDKAKGDASKT